MAPTYKLTYFPIRGLAEFIRMIFKAGNIEFEDERISYEEWANVKQTMPFGQLPVLTVNGKVYHQHLAIARFVGKQAKLSGANDLENLEIDIIADTLNDFKKKMSEIFMQKDETKKAQLKTTLINETLPYYSERLEKLAKENKGHLACKKLTWVDVQFAGICEGLAFLTGKENAFEKYPNLQTVKKNVIEIPAVKKWIEERPKTEY